MMMNDSFVLTPALLFIVAALIVPFLKGILRTLFILSIPLIGLYLVHTLPFGTYGGFFFFGIEGPALRVDEISKAFGYLFTLNAFFAYLYCSSVKKNLEPVSSLLYIGSALGVVFAANLVSLYLFWEVMAVSSTFLILAHGTKKSLGAASRYVLVHIAGGLVLLAGIVLLIHETSSIVFNSFDYEQYKSKLSVCLILVGFLVNAAVVPFSSWLPDAYSKSTITGGVILSAYTSKTAVYTLLRGYPGWDILIVLGAVMAIYGVIYAILENDMRRVLAFSIINQGGFMVAGVGIGTEIALCGVVAHAFCCVLYTSLLWMSAGAVLRQTNTSAISDLGGLYKMMPYTCVFGCVGAASIAALPLTSGFTSKTLIIKGAVDAHLMWSWLALEIASAGVVFHAGLKFPYGVFFGKKSNHAVREVSFSMRCAMGMLAALCVFFGVYPQPLYAILPFEVTYQAYTFAHVMTQLQLLLFSVAVYMICLPWLRCTHTIVLDFDWLYRKGAALFYWFVDMSGNGLNKHSHGFFIGKVIPLLNNSIQKLPCSVRRYLGIVAVKIDSTLMPLVDGKPMVKPNPGQERFLHLGYSIALISGAVAIASLL